MGLGAIAELIVDAPAPDREQASTTAPSKKTPEARRCDRCCGVIYRADGSCPRCEADKPQASRWAGIAAPAVLIIGGIVIALLPKSTVPAPTPTPDEASSPQHALYHGATLNVTMSIAAAELGPLTVSGETNLPDGTILSLLLRGDFPVCSPKCGFMMSQTTVQNGKFSGRILGERDPGPGLYTVDVAVAAGSVQPSSVQALMGPNGEGVRGPYVTVLGTDGHPTPSWDAMLILAGA